MKIIAGTFAVFWTRPALRGMQFHADVAADTARDAVRIFASLYPGDIVVSVRGPNGRFTAFN